MQQNTINAERTIRDRGQSATRRAQPRNYLSLIRPQSSVVHLDASERRVFADSRIVAEHFGKRHADVIRNIEKLVASGQIDQRIFASISYLDSHGRDQVAYDMTRDGFMVLVMGFTGPKALAMKMQFIAAFNAMESYIREAERTKLLAADTDDSYKLIRDKAKQAARQQAELLGYEVTQ